MERWLLAVLATTGLALGGLAPTQALSWDGGARSTDLSAFVDVASDLSVDHGRSLVVVDYAIHRAAVTYHFKQGTFYPVVDGAGHDVGAIFLGDGELTYAPDDPLQMRQLYQWTWFNTRFAEPFSQGFLVFTGESPLPSTAWGAPGRQGREAERVLRKRWRRHKKWVSLPDQGLIWDHSRGPNLALDLVEDRLDPVDGPGMRYVEVNAQPRKRSMYRRTTPQRWWMALYESPRGVQPVYRTAERGVLFVHGDQQGRWLSHVFYAYEPPDYGPSRAVDVLTADHTMKLRWDGQMERLHSYQDVAVAVEAKGQVARVFLTGREPRTGSTITRNHTPALWVEGVIADGQPVAFHQQNGELLFNLPEGFAGAVTLKIRGDIPLGGGAQRGDGPFAIYSPVGTYFDRVRHDVSVEGPEGFTVVLSQDLATDAASMAGSFEPPALSIGEYVEAVASVGDEAVVRGYAYRNQLQTPFEAEAVAAMMVREGRRALAFYEGVMGPPPFESLSFVESSRGYDPLGMVPMSAWTLRAQTQEARLDAFRNRAYMLAAQWWGNGVTLADPLEDYWLFAGLSSFMANWAMEATLEPTDWLEQHLDEWRRKALDAERPTYRVYVASGGGLEAQAVGVSARGYLLFNNLRHAVGDARMAMALRGVYETLEGQAVTSDTFVEALGQSLGLELGVFIKEGLPLGPYGGQLEVVYNLSHSDGGVVLQAVTDGYNPGPTLGAAILIKLEDGRAIQAFVPLGGGLEMNLPTGVKGIVPLKRGSGLVGDVEILSHPRPLWTDAVSESSL